MAGGTEFNGDDGIAVRAIDELNESLCSKAAVGSGLVARIDSLLTLRAKGHELLRLGSRLSYCRTAFVVDCGRNASDETAFRGLLEETRQLSGEIIKFGERMQDGAGVARANLRRQCDLTRSRLARLREYARLAQVAARVSCNEIEPLSARSGETMRDIADSSLGLRELADVAGYFMQFGGILRQKLERVPGALSTAEVSWSEPCNAIMLTLQDAHLDGVAVEIDSAVEKLEAALREMTGESEVLDGHFRELQECGGESGGQGGQNRLPCFSERIRTLSAPAERGPRVFRRSADAERRGYGLCRAVGRPPGRVARSHLAHPAAGVAGDLRV